MPILPCSHDSFVYQSTSSSPGKHAYALENTPGRARAPSNPVPPNFYPSTSPSLSGGSISRPHSRSSSQPLNPFGRVSSPELDYSSSRGGNHYGLASPSSPTDENDFTLSISTIPIPISKRSSSPNASLLSFESTDSDHVIKDHDRSAASSTVSLQGIDRVEALQKANADLGRKLMEVERTLQERLNDHEAELEEMEGRLEEVRGELSATKREEKELRSKEVSHLISFESHPFAESGRIIASKLNSNRSSRIRSCETSKTTRKCSRFLFFASTSVPRTMHQCREISGVLARARRRPQELPRDCVTS